MADENIKGYKRYKKPSDQVPVQFHDIITDLRDYLKNCGAITRVEFIGSGDRGTWLPDSDYDTFFMRREDSVVAHPIADGSPYAMLEYADGSPVRSRAIHDEFYTKLVEALEELGYASKVKLEQSNSSIVIDYYLVHTDDKPLFSVDVHISYEVKDVHGVTHWYIGGSPDGATGDAADSWQMNVEKAEAKETRRIGEVGRWAVRIVKAMKNNDKNVKPFIRSYTVEHTAYYLRDIHPDEGYWREDNIKDIVREMLIYLAIACKQGHLNDYVIHFNMLERMQRQAAGDALHSRLKWLAMEPQFTRQMLTI